MRNQDNFDRQTRKLPACLHQNGIQATFDALRFNLRVLTCLRLDEAEFDKLLTELMDAGSDLWLKAVATADFIFARVFLGHFRFYGTNVRREEGKLNIRTVEFNLNDRRAKSAYKLIIPPLEFVKLTSSYLTHDVIATVSFVPYLHAIPTSEFCLKRREINLHNVTKRIDRFRSSTPFAKGKETNAFWHYTVIREAALNNIVPMGQKRRRVAEEARIARRERVVKVEGAERQWTREVPRGQKNSKNDAPR